MSHHLAESLRAIVGASGLLLDDQVRARHAQAIGDETLRARALVRPESTAQVSAVLALCHQARCPVVAHGGLTGLVHGADADGDDVILSLERMNRIEDLSAIQRVAVVQAGVTLQKLQEAAQAAGLFFPLDLGARGSATIGGNVATNAGGNRVLRYGMMRDMVLGLEVVLADGTVLGSVNRMLKNNAGYDLKQLFIGSEGTLGVVTRVVLRLREQPASHAMALVATKDCSSVIALLKHMDRTLGGNLSAFEVMWREFYELVTTPPSLSRPPLPHGSAVYVLIESLGGEQAQDSARFQAILAQAMESGLVVDAVIAASERERAALWAMRDDVLQLTRDGRPFTYDVSLPLDQIEAYLGQVKAALTGCWPRHLSRAFGHLGDGNLHLAITVPDATDTDHEQADAIVYAPLAAIGGSISAEHGIGLDKKAWLGVSRNDAERSLMRALKRTLDPDGILNPGKVLD